MTIQKLSIELQNAVVTDGTTITGDGTEGNPLTAHLTGDGPGAGGTGPLAGTSAQRPQAPALGTLYFDTDLNRPIWWAGAGWRDAAGGVVAPYAPPASAYKHYRLLVTDLASGSGNNYVGVMELVLRTQPGGPQAAQGGTATASASVDFAPSTAFDGALDQDTGWIAPTGLQDGTETHLPTPVWLAYEFPAPVAIVEYTVHRYPYALAGDAARAAGGWQFQGSADGVAWRTLDTATATPAQISAAAGVTRTL